MASTLLMKSACNHRDDAAFLPGFRRVTSPTVLTSGVGQRAALLTLVLSALVMAAGCGGTALMSTPNLYALTSDNPFPDVPPCFRTNTVDVLYATDRTAESDIAQNPRYGYRRSLSLAFGMTTVRIGKDVSWDALVAASRSALRPTDLAMGTAETRELGRFPPTPSKTVERNGRTVYAPEVAEALLTRCARVP